MKRQSIRGINSQVEKMYFRSQRLFDLGQDNKAKRVRKAANKLRRTAAHLFMQYRFEYSMTDGGSYQCTLYDEHGKFYMSGVSNSFESAKSIILKSLGISSPPRNPNINHCSGHHEPRGSYMFGLTHVTKSNSWGTTS